MIILLWSNRKGGGISLYVSRKFAFHTLDFMSVSVDNLADVVTIELEVNKAKNIVIIVVINVVNEAYEGFFEIIKKLYDKHFPLKKVKSKKSSVYKPWLTNGLRKCCRRKHNLYKMFIRKRSAEREKSINIIKHTYKYSKIM